MLAFVIPWIFCMLHHIVRCDTSSTPTIASGASTQAYKCDHTSQCSDVSATIEAVTCELTTNKNGVCRCLVELGFKGNATLINKCTCKSPNQIFSSKEDKTGSVSSPKEAGAKKPKPYCVNIQDNFAYNTEKTRTRFLENQAKTVYNSLVWPTPALIMQDVVTNNPNGIMHSIFDIDARGRVDPMGEFIGFDGIVEYFYGTVWTGVSRISSVNIKKLSVQNNTAGMRVDLFFEQYNAQTGTLLFTYNLTQTAFFTFNEAGLITKAELIIHNLSWIGDSLLFPASDESIQQTCFLITSVAGCNESNDPNGYYSSFADCYQYMKSIPFGSYGYGRSNSVVCRQFHSLLAIARPDIHCPHSGKTGGMKCFDHDYNEYYSIDF